MKAAAALAAALAALTVPEFDDLVRELPHASCVTLCALCDDRVRAERAAVAPPVHAPAPPDDERPILTAPEAAAFLRISRDTLYARVERGELEALPRPPKGRLRFARAALASGRPVRYTPPHDATGRTNPAPLPRLDATRPRRRAPGDGDDGRPVGARGARRHAARSHEPYAPGQAAWRDDPDPKG